MDYELIRFKNDNLELDINVSPEEKTVWLTQAQIAALFETTQQNVSSHIKNILIDKELNNSVHKKILYTAQDGKTYNTSFYNLDMILAIGYRVKSNRAIEFRKWATSILEEYLLKGYVLNEKRTLITEENYLNLTNRVDVLENKMNEIETREKHLFVEDKVFYENQMFEALVFMNQIVETAKELIVLIDPYTDERTLNAFKKKGKDVSLLIVTSSKQKPSQIDIDTYEAEYGEVTIKIDDTNHDRFLIIDNCIFYQLGSSINYLGKRFTTIDLKTKPDFVGLIRNRAEQYL